MAPVSYSGPVIYNETDKFKKVEFGDLDKLAADPNAAPNPYKMQDNWLQLPEGRKLGQAIKVQVDHSDGKSIWVFDRCSSNGCNPIQKFDSNGKFVRAFGALPTVCTA